MVHLPLRDARIAKYGSTAIESNQGAFMIPKDVHDLRGELELAVIA
jgi:hypothetical protein